MSAGDARGPIPRPLTVDERRAAIGRRRAALGAVRREGPTAIGEAMAAAGVAGREDGMCGTEEAAWDVTWIHVSSHWDRHLSGWLRCGPAGRYHHFALTREDWVPDPDDPEDGSFGCQWSVYAAPREVALAHLGRARAFRSIVWWGWDFDPRTGSRWTSPRRAASRATKETSAAFYAAPKPPPVDLAACRLVGTTVDLRRVVPVSRGREAASEGIP